MGTDTMGYRRYDGFISLRCAPRTPRGQQASEPSAVADQPDGRRCVDSRFDCATLSRGRGKKNKEEKKLPENNGFAVPVHMKLHFVDFFAIFPIFYPAQYPIGHSAHPTLHSKFTFHHSWPKFSASHPTSKCISSTKKCPFSKIPHKPCYDRSQE